MTSASSTFVGRGGFDTIFADQLGDRMEGMSGAHNHDAVFKVVRLDVVLPEVIRQLLALLSGDVGGDAGILDRLVVKVQIGGRGGCCDSDVFGDVDVQDAEVLGYGPVEVALCRVVLLVLVVLIGGHRRGQGKNNKYQICFVRF